MRLILSTVVAGALLGSSAGAVSISFTAVDIPDVNPGENLYRYEYTLDEFPFTIDHGFSVLFDPTLYTLLESPPPSVGTDWDIITLQPDLGLPADGRYDALALDTPATLSGFSVEFVWLGAGTPGSQPFELYDPSFGTIGTGITVLVPEPGTIALFALGVVCLARFAQRDSRSLRREI